MINSDEEYQQAFERVEAVLRKRPFVVIEPPLPVSPISLFFAPPQEMPCQTQDIDACRAATVSAILVRAVAAHGGTEHFCEPAHRKVGRAKTQAELTKISDYVKKAAAALDVAHEPALGLVSGLRTHLEGALEVLGIGQTKIKTVPAKQGRQASKREMWRFINFLAEAYFRSTGKEPSIITTVDGRARGDFFEFVKEILVALRFTDIKPEAAAKQAVRLWKKGVRF